MLEIPKNTPDTASGQVIEDLVPAIQAIIRETQEAQVVQPTDSAKRLFTKVSPHVAEQSTQVTGA